MTECVIHRFHKLETIQKLKMKSSIITDILCNLLAVWCQIKDAYLIDCCILNDKTANLILSELEKLLQVNLGIRVINLGEFDLIFISAQALNVKVSRLKHDYDEIIPIIIDIDKSVPTVVDNSEKQMIFSLLYNILSDNSMEITDISNSIGYVFIAGWLLGYPSIYISRFTGDLNSQVLRKYSISTIHSKYLSSVNDNINPRYFEFSIPLCVLKDNPNFESEIANSLRRRISNCNQSDNDLFVNTSFGFTDVDVVSVRL